MLPSSLIQNNYFGIIIVETMYLKYNNLGKLEYFTNLN